MSFTMRVHSFLFLTFFLLFSLNTSAQDKVLLTIDSDSITAFEFKKVYNKNLDLVQDDSQKSIDNYLDLFINYQLKLKEAKRLKLDQDKKYIRELKSYERQLKEKYLKDNEVTDALVKEAYNRKKYEVNVSHILVFVDENTVDTTAAYNQILQFRKDALAKGFDKVSSRVNQNKQKTNKQVVAEDLGYFSVFKMVYPFETAAYLTKVGEISQPFRTRFGYHILKVNDKRPFRGTATAAHIMILNQQKDSTVNPEKRINEIYQKLSQGESFESLAKQFSEDKSTSVKGGRLAKFESTRLSSPKFEDVIFSLPNDQTISEPFKTKFGWHIAKRIRVEPLANFNALKEQLSSLVSKDSRSKLVDKNMVEKLRTKYDIVEPKAAKLYFYNIINDNYFENKWTIPTDFKKEAMLFSINDKKYTYLEFAKLLKLLEPDFNKKMSIPKLVDIVYDQFFEKSILQFRSDNLINENKEYAEIYKEYEEGLLLFDFMQKEIWNKASKDSLGLETYYSNNKSKYYSDLRAELLLATSTNKSVLKKVKKRLKLGQSSEEISKQLNQDEKVNVIFTKSVFEKGSSQLPEDFEFKKGISDIFKHNEAFHIAQTFKILPKKQNTLEEVKGRVINNYQEHLEKKLIRRLKNQFKIEINKSVLTELKTILND